MVPNIQYNAYATMPDRKRAACSFLSFPFFFSFFFNNLLDDGVRRSVVTQSYDTHRFIGCTHAYTARARSTIVVCQIVACQFDSFACYFAFHDKAVLTDTTARCISMVFDIFFFFTFLFYLSLFLVFFSSLFQSRAFTNTLLIH